MPRSVPEWIGKTDDTPVPAHVKLRIFDRFRGLCPGCGRRIGGNLVGHYDHIVAIINGGQNRESNIQLLCGECHLPKTGTDVREKAKVAAVRKKHLGIKPKGRPLPGGKTSPWKKTFAHGWVRR